MLHASLKRTGQKMPMIGYGLWKVDNATCADTVYNAIKTGYRLFDGAGDYGNEKEAGEGLQRAIKDGLVKREEIFVTSKLWNTYHRHDHVKIMAKKQLELWGMDYFDLFLIHFPIALEYVDPKVRYPPGWAKEGEKVRTDNTPLAETWKAMEELVDEGLAKNIGVSNYSGGLVLDLVRYARIQPAALQVELHPLLAQKKLVKLAQELGIAITAYSSFGPQSYVELDLHKGVGPLLQHNVILDIANARGRTPAQVLLRWALQQGICVIPKSNNPKRLVENLGCDNFELTSEDMAAIDSLNRDIRFNDPGEIDVRLSIFA